MNQSNPQLTRPTRSGFWLKSAVIGLVTVGALSACGHRGGWHQSDSTDPSARIEHVVDKVFSRVDASDAQKQKISVIANGAYKDLAPMRNEMRAARTEALNLLTAPDIDRSAIESLRAAQSTKMESAMGRATTAITDIAEVLTPEQRVQVREKMAKHMDKHSHGKRFWHRGS